jgi:uridine kinase
MILGEALQEKKVAQIADQITALNKRVILIAGPSSSGKTTFANRLRIQLKVNGYNPITLSTDDYFVDRTHTPVDENGDYDYESIDAVDVDLFNKVLSGLVAGDEVELPVYNFIEGLKEFNGKMLQIKTNQPIIIEGIHGLNEKLTEQISAEHKFKIYISALTQLNIDDHNRIPTTDSRLIRRIVRDSKYRGHDAMKTIEMWPSVRRGEEKNIFPYQEAADVMFNSALSFELAVLKKHAEPLLSAIPETSEQYKEAKRLLKFLSYFETIDDDTLVPITSILKEFIGGSYFTE